MAVRVLFDSMGCRTMKNRDWERLEKEGIQVAEFFPALLGQLQLRRSITGITEKSLLLTEESVL